MTLTQVKTFVIGVLQGWFTNKDVLDKFTETDSILYYNGVEIGSSEGYATDAEVTDAIAAAIAELNL